MAALYRQFILRNEDHVRSLYSFLGQNWQATAEQEKPLVVTVTGFKDKRNLMQNARLWAMLNEIASSAWIGGKQFSSDSWHEHFAREFIGKEELPNGGFKALSTTKLSVAEFSEYMTKIEAYATQELGVQFQSER